MESKLIKKASAQLSVNGKNYELRGDQAPAGLLTNGKAVTLVLKLRSDLMSACQVGQIADVVRVE